MTVLLIHLDGKRPNLAQMRLAVSDRTGAQLELLAGRTLIPVRVAEVARS